jgi:21S rRNA (GM2251-2'-O)-methyltransferase
MNLVVLSRGWRHSSITPLLYPTLYAYRAASLNRAIGRGIRRSKGVGFRGKEKGPDEGSHEGGGTSTHVRTTAMGHGGWTRPIRRAQESPGRSNYSPPVQQERDGFTSRPSTRSSTLDKRSFVKPPNSRDILAKDRMGKRTATELEDKPRRIAPFRSKDTETSFGRRSLAKTAVGRTTFGRDRPNLFSEQPKRASSYVPRPQERSPKGGDAFVDEGTSYKSRSRVSDQGDWSFGREESRDEGAGEHRSRVQERSSEHSDTNAFSKSNRNVSSSNSSPYTPATDRRIPISIPYTTPASEFLYGTSVVEAALRSKNGRRRKLYKLYIYGGENRNNTEKDAGIERMARRSGIEVARVSGDWLRLMDKMSNSRPHNGYILEASPLPRLPVTSLGDLTEENGEPGFRVNLEHQRREEAAVNGTSDFIPQSKFPVGRKPLVLFLDSILDPGNLGGIIRTASFLGVTAIAIAKTCADLSPVVLKASAGASEDISIFTVKKPAGFIADSKMAGWKIFAAVAPSGQKPAPISTDDLIYPLKDDPCILMLGGEGDGLRMNLRTKADVNLTIRGNGQSANVDSLNVSVATGILINSFMRRGGRNRPSPIEQDEEPEMIPDGSLQKPERSTLPEHDLF